MISFHSRGQVHGDSRDATLLCDGEKLVLVDFDWVGKAGKISYPTALLNPELYAVCHTAEDLKIRERNDIGILGTTLDNIWANEGRSKRI